MTILVATLAYDGTRYAGWQRQAGQRTVQGCVEEALGKIVKGDVPVRVAGRTDAGVHARGQRISFDWDHPLPPGKLILALAALLPEDISVAAVQPRPDGFDVKRDSLGKRYVYRVYCAPHRPLFERRYVWHRRGSLDLAAMREAAALLVGELDYESFRNAGCQEAHARRTVWRLDVSRRGETVSLEVRGNAFVRGMVRAISGTLIDVGRGRLAPGAITDILAARDRSAAGVTAPARGLTLEQVYLAEDEDEAEIPEWASWPGFRRPRY